MNKHNFFYTGLIFTPEVFSICKKYGSQGGGGREYWYYFINIYAFVLDNKFCIFKHPNELVHMQIHLTSFTEFTMILNQT